MTKTDTRLEYERQAYLTLIDVALEADAKADAKEAVTEEVVNLNKLAQLLTAPGNTSPEEQLAMWLSNAL